MLESANIFHPLRQRPLALQIIPIPPNDRQQPQLRGEIADLWVAAWSTTLPQIDFEARRAWLDSQLLQAQSMIVISQTTGDILGFALFDDKICRLDQIAVSPRERGSPAARLLLETVKQACGHSVLLDVNADNPRAVRFYEREGFRRIGTGANADSGLPTIAMRWDQAE